MTVSISRKRAERERESKLALIREQLETGQLTIRKASDEQMEQWRRERRERGPVRSHRRKRS
jgi:hypothetical protein